MSGFELARRRIEQGHRLRFYQDFYGRQWVKVQGGCWFWRSAKIYLANDEVIALKDLLARRRRGGDGLGAGVAPAATYR